jgi:hypothetical protein
MLHWSDKKNSEVYFVRAGKKILTEKLNRRVPRASKTGRSGVTLTASRESRNFAAQGSCA